MEEQKPLIELKNVTKEINGEIILKGINLSIMPNEFVTLLGPSGCGKTTTLRIIGGFTTPSKGNIFFDGKSVLDIPAYQRMTNTVFQRYVLFPHLDVFENVAFGLRIKSKKEQQKIELDKLLENHIKKISYAKSDDEKMLLEKEFETDKKLIKDPNYLKKQEIKKLKEELKTSSDKKIFKDEIKKIKKTFITRKIKEEILSEKVKNYLKLVGLQGFEERSIESLSGGQQQRVAIARALINEPKVLLLDEPLAALDLKMRQEMQYELKELQEKAGISFIFVTHDQEEALTMSDKIVVMNDGEIQQIGTPEDIYNDPANRFVASFIGESNIVPGIMKDDFLVCFDGVDYECDYSGFKIGEEVEIVIRPEDLEIVKKGKGLFDGVVTSVAFKGVHYEIDVLTKDRTYTVHTTDFHDFDEEVAILFNPKEDIHVMEKSTW